MKLKNRPFLFLYRLIGAVARVARCGAKPERVLIISTTGIGDTLFATPALSDLRQRHSRLEIGVLCTRLGATVLEGNPDLDRVLITPPGFSLITALAIWRFAPETVLLFHNSTRLHLLYAAFAGCRRFCGIEDYGTKGLNSILTHRLQLPLRTSSVERRQLLVGQCYGAGPVTRELVFVLSEREKAFGRAFRADRSTKPVIGLQPFAKDFYKQWPYHCWPTFAAQLQARLDCQFVVFGGREDRRQQDHLVGILPDAVAGPEVLREAAGVLSQIDLLVTPDTGMIHIATALGLPTIGLFSPTDPTRTAPRADTLHLIHQPNPCAGIPGLRVRPEQCFEKRCTMQFCMARITPEMVVAEVLRMLPATRRVQ